MQCPKCRQENAATAKFCAECGSRLFAACAACGAALAVGARFCSQCGAAAGDPARYAHPESYTPKHLAEKILTSRGALDGERKQVTVLFADLKGSLELLSDRDPEEARKLLDPVLERMMEAVHRYEGTVNQVMGDGIMALFGAPLAHEDHAVRGCYSALRMQESIRRYADEARRTHGVELRIRVGLNSGEVVVRSIGSDLRMDYSAVGQTTHLAARMEQLAMPGTTRLTAATLALAEGYVEVRPLGPVPVKGLPEPVEIYELTSAGSARTRLQVSRARGLTRFVGRDPEMEQLRRAAESARDGRGQVVAVVGEPGVGKSRLYHEFIHSHRTHGWLTIESGSVSYGKASAFLPLADLFRGYFKIEPRDDIRAVRAKATGNLLALDEALQDTVPPLLSLLDALPEDGPFLLQEPAARRRQVLAAAKRVLLRESQVQPLLLVFEDLHWVDGETQAFLDGLVESVPAACILLAVNYRPEYRHAWGGKTFYHQLRIDPLPPASAQDLLEGLLGTDASLAPLKALLIERTDGNPLYLEESVRTLVETGALAGARGACRLAGGLDSVRVPATVQAILAARIDRLEAPHKRLLQAAAVVGMDVSWAVLREVAQMGEEELQRGIAQLQAAEFLYEARLFPELEYSFKHALTHEVAYGGVLQERRKALHAAILEALEQFHADRLAEQVELLAHHAVRGGVPDKAVLYLRMAGDKAVARSANREAIGFFEQALLLLEALPRSDENLRMALAIRLAQGPALIGSKGASSAEVETHYQSAHELALRLADPARQFEALWNLWFVKFNRGDFASAMAAAEPLMQVAERNGDSAQILESHHAYWPTLSAMGEAKAAIAHMEKGARLYDRKKHGGLAYVYAGHDPGACCSWHLAANRWLLGFPDAAARDMADALRLAHDIRHALTIGTALSFAMWLEYQLGNDDRAVQCVDQLLELARAHEFGPLVDFALLMEYGVKRESSLDDPQPEQIRRVRGAPWRRAVCACMAAEKLGREGLSDRGRALLASLTQMERSAFYAPEVLRVEGVLAADPAAAERSFRAAIDLAARRAEKSLELRAATSLARLWQQQDKQKEARELLAPVYGWFTEGFETADLRTAKALLSALG